MRSMPRFKLEGWFSEWEFRARYHLTASDAESITISELLALASPADRNAFERSSLGYVPTWGMPELREVVASTYYGVGPEHILCFAGAEEGIYVAMHAILAPEDHAIVVTPNYQAAESVPLSLCDVTGIPLDPQDDWALNVQRLQDAVRADTKLISINFPHNPTGKILEREKFDELVAICRQRGIWLFSDEVYRLIERDVSRRLPCVADVYERGISLSALSKPYGLPGLRIGWIACQDRELLERMEGFKHYLTICNSGPSERLAIIALKARERILQRNRNLATANLKLLDEFFLQFPDLFTWATPDGGIIGYPRYHGAEGVEEFVRRLIEEASVLLLPASIYSSALCPTPPDHFRIGYGRANLEQGIGALRAFMLKE